MGVSLVEALVAAFLFALVLVATYHAHERGRWSSVEESARARAVQDARAVLALIAQDLRAAGRDVPQHRPSAVGRSPDEAFEFAGEHALALRGNLDAAAHGGGREHGLETDDDGCCPEVHAANDEVVVFALALDDDAASALVMRWDTSGTRDEAGIGGHHDSSTRDARHEGDGEIGGEEEVRVTGLALTPREDETPTTLYRITFGDAGKRSFVRRQPVADGIADLRFRYFDGTGHELPAPGGDDAGRAVRSAIRHVLVQLSVDVAASRPGAPRRRVVLEERVSPPNLGPGPNTPRCTGRAPRDVSACAGACGTVVVSWLPEPACASRAHVVALRDGPHLLASEVVVPSLDRTDHEGAGPPRARAVLTVPEIPLLAEGTRLRADVSVLASDTGDVETGASGTEAVGRRARLGPPRAWATGHSPDHPAWPEASTDNLSGVPITTRTDDASFPASTIDLTIEAPRFALDVGEGLPSPPWSTRDEGVTLSPALPCHVVLERSLSDEPRERTPAPALPSTRPSAYVFRVNALDAWNWGEGVTDPSRFLPGPDNLHAFASVGAGAPAAVVDASAFVFAGAGDDARFRSTLESLTARHARAPAPRALVPGELHYYRVRFVDACWSDEDRNGEHDAGGVSAWSLPSQFDSEEQWRKRAMSLSPFFPPLRPDADDSDDVRDGEIGRAIPGHALPPTSPGGDRWLRPEPPRNLVVTSLGERGGPLPDGRIRVCFDAARRTEAQDDEGHPEPLAITTYELHRWPASAVAPPIAELERTPTPSSLLLRFRTSGPLALRRLTLDSSAEGAPTAPGALVERDERGRPVPCVYRLVALQAADVVLDDGIDTAEAERSRPSLAFLHPCPLERSVLRIDVTPDRTPDETSVSVRAVLDDTETRWQQPEAVRLLASDAGTGDTLGSSRWRLTRRSPTDDHAWTARFGEPDVSKARAGFEGEVRWLAEFSSSSRNAGSPGEEVGHGCRVRSDLVPRAASSPIAAPVGSHCEAAGEGALLSDIHPGDVRVESTPRTLEIRASRPSPRAAWPLLMLEVDVESADGSPLPAFERAEIGGVLGGLVPLPPHHGRDALESGPVGGDGRRWRLRWSRERSFLDARMESIAPILDAASPCLVVRLHWAGDACRVRLASLAFRTRVADGDELLCSRRASTDPEPAERTGPGRLGPDAVAHGCAGSGT